MTSPTNGTANDPPRFTPLSIQPINFSLTAGTSIPAPLESPPPSPTGSIGGRPPTPGGGPLTSHPTTPEECLSGAFPPTPPGENVRKESTASKQENGFRKPLSPASATAQHTTMTTISSSSPETMPKRRPSGVRRLLSMTSLRSSFASSRASLLLPSDNNTTQQSQQQQQQHNSLKRPSSPSILSSGASTLGTNLHNSTNNRHELRGKKSASWFRRKSSLFFPSSDSNSHEDAGFLDAVEENYRPEARESKKIKDEQSEAERRREEAKKAGWSLPEIRSGDGSGELGWDDGLFERR